MNISINFFQQGIIKNYFINKQSYTLEDLYDLAGNQNIIFYVKTPMVRNVTVKGIQQPTNHCLIIKDGVEISERSILARVKD